MSRWSVVLLGDDDGAVVDRIEQSRTGLTVVRSCSGLSEVLGTVSSGIADAVLMVAPVPDLTRSLLEAFHQQGVPVVMLGDAETGPARTQVRVPVSAEAEVLEQALDAAREELQEVSFPDTVEELVDQAEEPEPDASAAPGSAAPDRGQGVCVVVWGPWGAPGTTTVALNLAGELAALGRRTCLVDANTCASSCAAGLGLMEETSGLSRACRAAERGALDAEALAEAVDVVRVAGTTLDVLTGITRADRWAEIRPVPLELVLDQARRDYEVVVVDVAPPLEQDDAAAFDPSIPQRHGAGLAALRAADRILAVGQADPIGIPRLVRALGELEELGPEAPVDVVINRWRPQPVGADASAQLEAAWQRFGAPAPIRQYLPADTAGCDRALLRGSLLLEESPRSPLRQGLQELAARCTHKDGASGAESMGPAASTARGWRRLLRR